MKRKTVNILGKDHEITYKTLRGLYGCCHNGKNKIDIHRNLEGEEHDQTLLHEMFHAAIYRLGLHSELNTALEEILVETLAHVVVDNFKITEKGE